MMQTPNLGQGGCCALEDAVVRLKEVLADVPCIFTAEETWEPPSRVGLLGWRLF